MSSAAIKFLVFPATAWLWLFYLMTGRSWTLRIADTPSGLGWRERFREDYMPSESED